MHTNKQSANDILDGYLMTQENHNNKSGFNAAGVANGNSYDDNCLTGFDNNETTTGVLNKTNISMISHKSMS